MTTHPDQLTHNGYALWWVEDQDETIIARTEQEARAYYEATDKMESGPVTWNALVRDEDGSESYMSELLEALTDGQTELPTQMSTQYN